MESAKNSPSENVLPEGLKEGVLDIAVKTSGYPLQNVIASYLKESFDIVEEWGFIDRDTQKHRSLDLHAYRSLKKEGAKHFDAALVLLLECKRAELPYVFFKAASARTPSEFPHVVGFRSPYFELQGKNAIQEHPPASFLRLHELPFVNDGPTICNAFTQSHRKGNGLELSGDVAYNSVVLPLAGAMQHWKQITKPPRSC